MRERERGSRTFVFVRLVLVVAVVGGSMVMSHSAALAASCSVTVDTPYVLNRPVDIDVPVPVVHAGGYGYCPGSVFTTTQVCLAGSGLAVCSGSGRAGERDGSDAESVCIDGGLWIASASVVGTGTSTGTVAYSGTARVSCPLPDIMPPPVPG